MAVFAWVILFFGLATGAVAADGPVEVRNRRAIKATAFRTSSDLVLINASAYDRQGRLVTDIRRDDIRLFSEGVEQQIAAFSLEDVPVSVAIVLDVSRSMRSALPHIQSAMRGLSAASKPEDEYMLLTVRDVPAEAAEFTRDIDRIERSILSQEAVGNTAIVDAMMLAFHKVRQGRNARKAVLVLSDGRDTNSRYRWRELVTAARESTAPLYALLLPGFDEDDWMDASRVRQIAEDTGGKCIMMNRAREIPDRIGDLDIHRQYVVGFVPASPAAAPRYRRVALELRTPERRLQLSWRRGYYR